MVGAKKEFLEYFGSSEHECMIDNRTVMVVIQEIIRNPDHTMTLGRAQS